MPLPEALAQRLAKRGILQSSVPASKKFEEEIIAEDYDAAKPTGSDIPKRGASLISRDSPERYDDLGEKDADDLINDVELKIMGHPGCPNKWNIYHECSPYCRKYWKDGVSELDPKYLTKRKRYLRLYPLPLNWEEKYDPGTGRHYYWDQETDLVSWLPPGHPKAVITESASHFREEMSLAEGEEECDDDDDDGKASEDERELSDEEDLEERQREEKLRKQEEREKARAKGRSKTQGNELDPMDPASYSDTPRGTWSTGLAKKNEARTGADTTAAGSLYQMRPYPNPGAVLRANAAKSASHEKTKVQRLE